MAIQVGEPPIEVEGKESLAYTIEQLQRLGSVEQTGPWQRGERLKLRASHLPCQTYICWVPLPAALSGEGAGLVSSARSGAAEPYSAR